MSEKMMPLDEFLQLDTDAQVEKLKRWKMTHTLKDIREVWNFKHSAQYYMLLKKLNIYERVVNKSDKFYPANEALSGQRSGYGEPIWRSQSGFSSGEPRLVSDSFDYYLNTTLSGPELADRLERIAHFLKGEQKSVTIRLSIETSYDQQAAAASESSN